MTKEEAERRAQQEKEQGEVHAHNNLHHHHIPPKPTVDGNVEIPPHSPRNEEEVEKTLADAERSTDKQTGKQGRRRSEEEKPDRTLVTHTNDARISTTLPIVQEVGENGSRQSSRRGDETPDEKHETDHVPEEQGAQLGEEPHQDQEHKHVEYTVTDDEHHFHHHDKNKEETLKAPLDGQEVEVEVDSRRVSKPPRIASGIIPATTPMYGEDEIGVAR